MADRMSGDHRAPSVERSRSPDVRLADQGVLERVRLEPKAELQDLFERAAARDHKAQARDRAATLRDRAAHERDIAIALGDVTSARRDSVHAIGGTETSAHTAGQRDRAARQRQTAAEYRIEAAGERKAAARDREQSAQERVRSRDDREALAAEIRHQHALRDDARRLQRHAEKLARTLQRSLSPPRLPAIAGIDVAVHYEPSAPEEVGGDFYDLFPLAPGRSGFFLGDVGGKGPDAASVTSLARYTMRTSALLHQRPEDILMDLNIALIMDADEPMQTCTAVYGQIDIDDDARITLAVAGHLPPLVVRRRGTVEVMPAHGTLLGVFDDPDFEVCEVHLGSGDAIVIYSDGMIDTEIDGVRMDEPRIAELLSGAAPASAQALVARLTDATRGNHRPLRDDVAILALRRTPAGE